MSVTDTKKGKLSAYSLNHFNLIFGITDYVAFHSTKAEDIFHTSTHGKITEIDYTLDHKSNRKGLKL